MIWHCWCGKEIQEMVTMAKDKEGNETHRIIADPDLSNPSNPCNPASRYWNVEHNQVFCGAEHMIRAQRIGYDLTQLEIAPND